jgi:hypothetical protein
MNDRRIECKTCGGPLNPDDDVRQVYRELADAEGESAPEDRWAYTHVGHEPAGTAYRITGRGRLAHLEAERLGGR